MGFGRKNFLKILSNSPTCVRGRNRGDAARKTGSRYRSGSCATLLPRGAKVECGGLFLDIGLQIARGPPQTWSKFTSGFGRFRDFEFTPVRTAPDRTEPARLRSRRVFRRIRYSEHHVL